MNKRKLVSNVVESSSYSKRAKTPVEGNVIRYYITSPSLEHLSATKIIIALWGKKNIKEEIMKICKLKFINCRLCERFVECTNSNELWEEIINKVLDMVLELSEFDVIRKILSNLINPIGQEIFDWIDYQDKFVFCYNHCTHQNVAVNYLHCLVWTSRGLIDYEETAKTLLANYELFEQDLYSLACLYCLEEYIAIMMTKLSSSLRSSYLNLHHEDIMVCFWTAHLTGEFTNLIKELDYYNIRHKTDYGFNECVFYILVSKHRNNQVAIKFMWNKLSEDEKLRQIFSVIKYCKTDLKCFFISQISEFQQEQVFISECRGILLCLLDDWLWKDHFLPTMHHLWDIISGLDFLLIVEDIVNSRMEKLDEKIDEYKRYKAILKEMWRSAPKYLKEFIFEFENGSRGRDLLFILLCQMNADIIQLMVPDISHVQKDTMMFPSFSNFHKCYQLIINDEIDVVKSVVRTIFSERYEGMFKRMLFESYGHNYGHDIAVHFWRNQRRDKVDEFLQWIFISDNDVRQFKANLARSEISDDILDSIVADDDEKNFAKLENFFQWCASGDTEETLQLKRKTYEVHFTKVICKFVEKDNYQLLDQFLNWCFSGNERKVELVNHTFHEYHNKTQLANLVKILVEKNNQLQSLEKFVCWCFAPKRKIARFKKWILQYVSEDTVGVCLELLCKGMFELADEFIHWCCDSSQMKISKFKMKLMLCDDIEHIFTNNEHEERILEKVIKWFNPTVKMIIQFRKKFVHFHWLKDNDIAVLLIKNQKWVDVDLYIQLIFNSDTDKDDFKKKLAYSKICDDILESIIVEDNEVGFGELEKFFLWCASENTEVVIDLKVEMYQQYFAKVICKLIEGDKYQLLEKFSSWCYRNEKQRVELLKLYFLGYHKYFEIVQLVLNLVERNDHMQSLEKFVRWCFTENGEVTRFKNFLLEPGMEDTIGVCMKLLSKSMFEVADEFVCWCCDSSREKVCSFKNKLMLYEGMKYLFNLYKSDENYLYNIFQWFNPSEETKALFRAMFKDLRWACAFMPLTFSNVLRASI